MRRYLVFLYVPLVPLAGEDEFVQCGFCRRAFKPSILESGRGDDAAASGASPEVRARGEPALAGPAAEILLMWEPEGE